MEKIQNFNLKEVILVVNHNRIIKKVIKMIISNFRIIKLIIMFKIKIKILMI